VARMKKVIKKKAKKSTYIKKIDWTQVRKDLLHLIANSNMGWRSCLKELEKFHKKVPVTTTVENWLLTDKEFMAQYARAKEDQADFLAEEILQISDDSSEDEIFIEAEDGSGQTAKRVCNNEFIARSRLRVDSRKWIASKLKPKKYGDKVDVTSGNEPLAGTTIILSDMELAAKVAYILQTAIQRKKKAELIELKGENEPSRKPT